MNSRERMSLPFPGGTVARAKPSREQLLVSASEWSDLIRQSISVENWHGAKGAAYQLATVLNELQAIERET